jgi:hypothetical protein
MARARRGRPARGGLIDEISTSEAAGRAVAGSGVVWLALESLGEQLDHARACWRVGHVTTVLHTCHGNTSLYACCARKASMG